MPTPEERLHQLGLSLPPHVRLPDGLILPFSMVNRRGNRVLISGHPRHGADGAINGPFGKVGADLTLEDAQNAAQDIGLCVLSHLKAELGELSRITGWARVFGMVASAPGFSDQHLVINGFSNLILDVFGPDVGRHARSAIGVTALPMNFAIEIEGEVLVD
jgi:enamine deaminase RidA (YjgF/YER057c/UK114 family)